jgi:tetratricopeptide (TPR) repeat protein
MVLDNAVRAQGPPVSLTRVAQVRDSIGRLLQDEPRLDTLRVMSRLNTLSFILRTNEAPQAKRLAQQSLALAQRLGFSKGLVEAHFNLGYCYRGRNQYDSAIYHSQKALDLSARMGNRYTQTRAYYSLARIYTEQGNYAAAWARDSMGLPWLATSTTGGPSCFSWFRPVVLS